MLKIKNKEECCGCEVCANICPQGCIHMVSDEKGFLYPQIDKNSCIGCNLCEQVCPVKTPAKRDSEPELYAVQNMDDKIRKESTSGGMFSAIAKWVLKKGGSVIGVAYDEDFRVVHKVADSEGEGAAFRGSKYVQSRTGNIYRKTKEILDSGRWVCFSGTPCQCNALVKYLGKEYEKLVLVDVLCRGVTSPLFLEKYKAYHREKAGADIISLKFREKYYGYGYSTMQIQFSNDTEYRAGMESDILLKSFFIDLNTRESCHACQFKTISRVSDFTLFDGWHIKKYDANMDDDKGTTLCLLQSEKSKRIYSEIKGELRASKVPTDMGIALDGIMALNTTAPNRRREEFFKDIQHLPIPEIQKKYYPITVKRRILKKIKPLTYKLGLFNIYMQLKKKG